jgi:hypothetical protein
MSMTSKKQAKKKGLAVSQDGVYVVPDQALRNERNASVVNRTAVADQSFLIPLAPLANSPRSSGMRVATAAQRCRVETANSHPSPRPLDGWTVAQFRVIPVDEDR